MYVNTRLKLTHTLQFLHDHDNFLTGNYSAHCFPRPSRQSLQEIVFKIQSRKQSVCKIVNNIFMLPLQDLLTLTFL